MLKNIEFPEALNKLYRTIDRIREGLYHNDFETRKRKVSQSYQYYGFYIELTHISLWFGYWLPLWLNPIQKNECTPLYMQFRSEWIRGKGLDAQIEPALKKCGFIKTDDHGWLKPYSLDLMDKAEQALKIKEWRKLADEGKEDQYNGLNFKLTVEDVEIK